VPDPFISAQDLSNYLGRDVSADNGTLICLDAACDIVRDIAEHPVNSGTATLSFDGTGTDAIVLPYHPITAAGTVTVAGSAVTDYMLAANGVLLRGSAGVLPRPVWPEGRQNVQVTFEYGYLPQDIPRSVRMVALSIATRLMVQGPALRETLGDASVQYATAATDLTNGERRVLQRFRRARSW
jgi:hypothetical protein